MYATRRQHNPTLPKYLKDTSFTVYQLITKNVNINFDSEKYNYINFYDNIIMLFTCDFKFVE